MRRAVPAGRLVRTVLGNVGPVPENHSAVAVDGTLPDPWPAPTAPGRVVGSVRVPGSKSLTNRHLVLAALTDGPTVLRGALRSRDADLMRAALETLGARFEELADGALRVHGLPVGEPLPHPVRIDCGLAGTVMRFVPFVAALRPGVVHIDGDPEARARPMGATVSALRQLGVQVAELGEPGRLPLTLVVPHRDASATGPAEVAIDASASSQFLSGALLSGWRLPGGLTLRHTGARVPSPEHVAMTVRLLAEHGITTTQPDGQTWRLCCTAAARPVESGGTTARPPGSDGAERPGERVIEPDLSNAGVFLAAAAVTGGRASVPNWPAATTQIGARWPAILEAFGARVEHTVTDATGVLTVHGPVDAAGRPRLRGAGELADTAELAPTVAALALLAEGPTSLTGIGHLRGHETDRLAALAAEAARFGVSVREGADRLDFPGTRVSGAPRPATAQTYRDHRMATFAAILGLAVPGTHVVDVGTTAKTMPDFPARWTRLVDPTPPTTKEPRR